MQGRRNPEMLGAVQLQHVLLSLFAISLCVEEMCMHPCMPQ